MIDELLDPFAFEFFRYGLAAATLAGALLGLLGVFVVLKGMSYLGHGLSHAIFGGFAASALLGVNVLLGAGVWGVASALMIGGVTRRRPIGADAAIGVITTASFALGLALFALFGRAGVDFEAALFGSVLGVDGRDVLALALIGALAGGLVLLRYRALLFATFDPEVADASGVRTARIDALLMMVLALAILASLQVLGRHPARRRPGDPGRGGADADGLVRAGARVRDRDRCGLRVRGDEPELPPRRAVRADDRAGRRGALRAGLRRHRGAAAADRRPGRLSLSRPAGPR